MALMGLLSAILDKTIADVAVKQNEPSVDYQSDKQIRFDINCAFNDGELADIEMTVSPDTCEVMRIEYYCSKLYTGQDIKGVDKTYNDLKHTYQISIVNESILTGSNFMHHFDYVDQYGEHLGGRTHIIILELSKLNETLNKPVEELTCAEAWAVFFRYGADRNKRELVNRILEREEPIAMAGALLQTLSKDDHVKARLLSEYKYEVDLQSKMVGAERKGKTEGKLEGKIEIASNLKRLGIPLKQITEATGLSIQDIEKL